jgi:hypothetical protein
VAERDGLECDDPAQVLARLDGRASRRKLRLFGCASLRRVWHLLPNERCRRAVATAEAHADGLADAEGLREAHRAARQAAAEWRQARTGSGPGRAAILQAQRASALAGLGRAAGRVQRLTASAAALGAAAGTGRRERVKLLGAWRKLAAVTPAGLEAALWQALALPAWRAVRADQEVARRAWAAGLAAERAAQCGLLRDLLGGPSRAVRLDPSWLAWGGRAVRKMAEVIYEEGQFEDLPVLADALEEAGCADPDILNHCRAPGVHVRGCWVVDLLLGKS